MLRKNLYLFSCLVLIIFSILVGCSKPIAVGETDSLKERISSMSIDDKVAQMLMVGIEGNTVTEETKNLLKEEHIGGIILNGYNITNSNQLLKLTNDLKLANSKYNKIPLFISTDEEGGLVSRMPAGIINLPNSREIGNNGNAKLAFQVGRAIGERVSSFGINMTMAPVLDINTNPRNPVIGKRSFGPYEEVVSNMGITEMKGIQSENTIPVLKHFPGHGDTITDSHKGLPIVFNGKNRLDKMELVPFKKAIQQKADVTMVAHILIPKLDSQFPSSLSKIIVTDLLRNELNFHGVIMTDDLTMGAILKNYSISDAAVKAVKAGNDIVLVCHSKDNGSKALNAIIAAVKNGDISEKQIDESVYRILSLKEKYKINNNPIKKVNVKKINESSKKIYKSMKIQSHL